MSVVFATTDVVILLSHVLPLTHAKVSWLLRPGSRHFASGNWANSLNDNIGFRSVLFEAWRESHTVHWRLVPVSNHLDCLHWKLFFYLDINYSRSSYARRSTVASILHIILLDSIQTVVWTCKLLASVMTPAAHTRHPNGYQSRIKSITVKFFVFLIFKEISETLLCPVSTDSSVFTLLFLKKANFIM